MSSEYEFAIECPVCDISTKVTVIYDQDLPSHCPMCGEDVEPSSEEED